RCVWTANSTDPSAHAYAPYGTIMLCRTPTRAGIVPVPCHTDSAGVIHSARHSSIAMSMRPPIPVRSRRTNAARIDEYAYIPDAISAIETPTFAGDSGPPVTDTTPDSACTSMSYAF